MHGREFLHFRKKLEKTQKQMAQLLGTSLKAIHSYEQGWRRVPAYVEIQVLFLLSSKAGDFKRRKPCWAIKNCSGEIRKECPVWEFQVGKFCWIINGTICGGVVQKNWQEKMKLCRSCEVLVSLLRL